MNGCSGLRRTEDGSAVMPAIGIARLGRGERQGGRGGSLCSLKPNSYLTQRSGLSALVIRLPSREANQPQQRSGEVSIVSFVAALPSQAAPRVAHYSHANEDGTKMEAYVALYE